MWVQILCKILNCPRLQFVKYNEFKFSCMDLFGVQFSCRDLVGVQFSCRDLVGVQFSCRDLVGVQFSSMDLVGVLVFLYGLDWSAVFL